MWRLTKPASFHKFGQAVRNLPLALISLQLLDWLTNECIEFLLMNLNCSYRFPKNLLIVWVLCHFSIYINEADHPTPPFQRHHQASTHLPLSQSTSPLSASCDQRTPISSHDPSMATSPLVPEHASLRLLHLLQR